MATKSTNAVAVAPATLSPAELMAALQQTGMVTQPSVGFRRLRLDSGVLNAYDEQGNVVEMFPPKMVKGELLPSVTLRIVEPPIYYNAFWLGPEFDDRGNKTGGVDASRIGRPDLNGNFSKHYDDPAEQAKDNNPANEVYDQIAQVSGGRGAFKGDLKVQIVPESGELTGEEPIYILSLSTTAALDWRGTRNNPEGGTVQDKNFIVQLGELAVTKAAEAGASETADLQRAVLDAMTSLRLGGVVADLYLRRAQNDDGSRTWTVPSFSPVHIEPVTQAPAIESGETDDLTTNTDDIGF